MPYPILSAELLVPELPGRTARLWVEAPDVARAWHPGQFVIVRAEEGGERIPLTISGGDAARGAIQLVVQEVGATTALIASKSQGEELADVCGPLGTPSELSGRGTCVVVAGGYGAAAVLPIAAALEARSTRVVGIVGARTSRLLVLVEELRAVTDALHVTTDDGSAGLEGNVLGPLRDVLAAETVSRVVAIGPLPMMRAVAAATAEQGVATVASLNPIMIDGTGMCGACRVHVGGETRFACVDGPEFDAHAVDFDELAARLGTYRDEEARALLGHGAAEAAAPACGVRQ